MVFVNQPSRDVILNAQDISRTYREGRLQTPVLKGISLQVHADEKVAIVGSSGSGKSTLLHVLGGLDRPDEGVVTILEQKLYDLNEFHRGKFRNRYMGFVYQFHHLLREFTALENVSIPLLVRGLESGVAESRARMMLERVGLLDRAGHKPGEMSGGERQRVAVARAAVTEPRILLADEPTGNLDEENADKVFALFDRLNREMHTALIVVTHDPRWEKRMDRVVRIRNGLLMDD